MINCSENENDHEKMDVEMDTNIHNTVYLGKITSICNKQV